MKMIKPEFLDGFTVKGDFNLNGDAIVTINNALLDPAKSQKLRNHSPDGFMWGYGGSGPAQLALGILQHVLKEDWVALAIYQDFKRYYVAAFPFNEPFKAHISGNALQRFLLIFDEKIDRARQMHEFRKKMDNL